MKQSELSFELPRCLQQDFENLYKKEKEFEKCKNTNLKLAKQSHVIDFFKNLDMNRVEGQKIGDLRCTLEKELRNEGCASYRDLTEE